MTTRRGFLGMMLGGLAAPAIVKADNLMKIVVPKKELILPQPHDYLPSDLNPWNVSSCHPQRKQMYAEHFDQFPSTSEDGIVISERMADKLHFETYEKRRVKFPNDRYYPIDLFDKTPGQVIATFVDGGTKFWAKA